jgi:uncharacterized damage-inducible protein DinB
MSDQTLIELLHGKGAHANPLACVEDLSMELAGRRTDNLPHSIWQLLSHMNYWIDYELKRIRHENPFYPAHAAESWPANPAPPSEKEWMNAVALFKKLLAELATLADSPSEILQQQVAATHPDHAKHSSSLLAILWQTLAHNSYHIGQIALLRRAPGAWPPKGGGDSW